MVLSNDCSFVVNNTSKRKNLVDSAISLKNRFLLLVVNNKEINAMEQDNMLTKANEKGADVQEPVALEPSPNLKIGFTPFL